MAKQVQVQRKPGKREEPPADAPTTSKKITKLWFSGN